MTIDEAVKILEMQEEILQFTHFTNEDAWELGCMLVAEARRRQKPVAISIRLNNGYTVFQFGLDGTTLYNEQQMKMRHNTVKVTEKSSLHLCTLLQKTENDLDGLFLDPKKYAISGGAFPIRIEDVGVIGSIIVSGMDHMSDHDLLIKCISKYLHIDEVPRIRGGKL